MKWNRIRVLEVYRLYMRYRSHSKVGKEIGLSRERVRQILVRGKSLSWIKDRNPPRGPQQDDRNMLNHWSREKISQALLVSGRRCKTGTQLVLSLKKFDLLRMYYGIDWQNSRRKFFIQKIVKRFSNYMANGGEIPSSYILQRTKGGKALYHRILYNFNSYERFVFYLKNNPPGEIEIR